MEMENDTLINFDTSIDPRYTAPYIEGWKHVGNSVLATKEEVGTIELPQYFPNLEKRVEPFFPDGNDPQHRLHQIKWAIYVKD